jgi:hypothetical protein
MVHRVGQASENHYGRFNAKARKVGRDDGSVSLLQGTKINLARPRFYDSQTNRETLDCSSSRSAQERFRRQRRGIGSSGNSCGVSARLFCCWSRSFISLRVRPKLEPEIGPSALASTGCIAESAISESYQAGIPNRENCLGIPLATPGYRRTGSMIISAGVEEGLNNVTRRSCQNQTDSLPLRGLSALLTADW